MEAFRVSLFRSSFRPFVTLLQENKIGFRMQEQRIATPQASGGTIELVMGMLTGAAFWGALAAVIVAFIKGRSGRKVIITAKDHTVIHAEGLTAKELEQVLQQAQSLIALDPGKPAQEE